MNKIQDPEVLLFFYASSATNWVNGLISDIYCC